MREKRKKIGLFIILLFAFSFISQAYFLNLEDNSIAEKNPDKIDHSGVSKIQHTRQWIINGNFSSPDNWNSTKGPYGDPEDVDATISGGTANYTINGESGKYSISGVPNSTWTAYDNPDWGVGMDEGTERGIGNYGCWASYEWDEDADQTGNTPSVQWKRNITLPVNMLDYKITSASLNVTFNATVTATGTGGIDVLDDVSSEYIQVGDYARFYVLISDVENVYQPFQVANNRTKYLGDNGPPEITTIVNTSLTNIDESLLINYLELILGINSTTFTMTLGIDLYCEDNNPTYDLDTWDKLRINFINLTFTYEKKIDQQTSVSWNQQGDKPSDVIANPFVIDEAILNFKYKTNDTWPKASSPNSEVRIWINEFQHTETIKLEKAKTTFQNASTNGFDVTRLIDKDKDINVSIQVYLADEFELNRTITFSIDEVYLNITYTEDVSDIETKLQLFLNDFNKTDDPAPFISLPLGVNLNITVKYTNLTEVYIPLADVNLEGKVSGTLDPDPPYDQYSIIVNTSDLGIGVSILTVIAQKPYYETNETKFFVEVTERETELELYIESIQKFDGDIVQLEINETLNVTVIYNDLISTNPLSNATVELVGVGEFNETNGQYNITINANDLGEGITAFTISAQLINYVPQSIQFFVEIVERATKLSLYINGNITNAGDTIKVELDKKINITAEFRDNLTEYHLPNATITLLGWDDLNETNEQYTIIINSNDLNQGITALTVFAQLPRYQSQSINFFIEVIEKSTIFELLLNSLEKTLDPVFNLTIGGILNIIVKYTNQTGASVPNAIVQLVGEGMLINLTWDDVLKQHYTELNTLDLEIGINLFSIIARATNYEIQTINPIITVNRIRTSINISSQITAEPRDDVLLSAILNNLDFGGTVTNATVTFTWAYSQGELIDTYNNGTYEGLLENVPEGTYTITITAFAGDQYDFESKEITLIVSSPTVSPGPDLSWLIYVLVGGIVGLVTFFSLYQIHFKYPPMVRKIRKLRKKIGKGKKTKPIMISNRKDIIDNSIQDQTSILVLEPKLPEEKISKIKN